jgi:hypothetical protein
MSSANPSTIRLPLSKLALNAPTNASDYPSARASTTAPVSHKQSLSRPAGQPGSPRSAGTTPATASSHRPSTSTAHHHTAQGLHGPAHATHLRVASSSLATSAQQAASRGLDRVDIGTYDGGFEADERKRESTAPAAAPSGGQGRQSEQGGGHPQQQDAAHQPEAASQITGCGRRQPLLLELGHELMSS